MKDHQMEIVLRKACQAFLAARSQERMNSMQRIALQIIAGIDMDNLLSAPQDQQKQAQSKLIRLIERERLKGVSGHWSYDLNRHIALKQALDRLGGEINTMKRKTVSGIAR